MSKREHELAKSEWSLLEALWTRGRATATELQNDLKEQQGWAYSTVKTMLDRLVDKGFVNSRRVGNVYEYSAKLRRQSAVGRVVDDVFDRVLEGSVAPFLDRLIQSRRLSKGEIEDLHTMLNRYSDEDEPTS